KPANEKASGQAIVLPCRDGFGKAHFASIPEAASVRGIHKGAAAPLVGGAAAWDVPAGFAGAARVAAWGGPARPGFPPEGERGRLTSLRPQADSGFMPRSRKLWCASCEGRT